MSELLTAAQAVAAVMRDVSAVAKDKKTSGGGPSYSFRSIDGLINALAGPIHRHGLILVPHVVASEIVPMPGRNGWTETRLTVEYDVIGPDGSALPRPVRAFAVGADNSGDKGAGKAMSYAYKAAISQLLCIPTDDPAMDNEAASIPEPAATVTRAQVKQIVSLFDGLEDEAKEKAKRAWKAVWGEDPYGLPAESFDAAYASAMDLVEAAQ